MSPTWRKKRFEKGEALRLFRTNSSKELFEEKTEKTSKKNSSMGVIQKRKENKRILPFVTQFQPSVPNLKQILMSKWHLITNQPLLKETFEGPPLISYKKGHFLHTVYMIYS